MDRRDPTATELVLSDLHHRVSGVSASVRAMLPAMSRRYRLVFVSGNPDPAVKNLGLLQVFRLLRQPVRSRPFRIWHVRRNNEMLWGLIARDVLRCPLRLVFTSAAIRRHSWYPRQLIRRMDAVIATSTQAARHVPKVKAIVPHGVDLDRFGDDSGIDGPLTKTKGQLCVGIAGRVRPEKGTDLFVAALVRVLPRYPNVKAAVIGKTTPKYRRFADDLKRQLRGAGVLDRVQFIDEIDHRQMPDVYRQLDVVCCPARYEGFGLVPLEAMVSGTAVIASRTGAYEDIVENDETGCLIDIGATDQLVAAMERILGDESLRVRMQRGGRQRVESRFSLEREVDGVSSVYESVWQTASGDPL